MSVYLKKFCPRISNLSRDEKKTWVRDVLKRDSRPKNMLIGMVAGHFTEEEFAFFIELERGGSCNGLFSNLTLLLTAQE